MFDHFLEWLSARYQPRFRLFREAKELYERFYRTQNFLLHQRTDEDRRIALNHPYLKAAEYKFKEALRLSEEVKEYEDVCTARFQLGMLYHIQGRYEEAVREFNICMELIENLPQEDVVLKQRYGDCHFHLGLIAMFMGNFEEGRRHLMESRSVDESLNEKEGVMINTMAMEFFEKKFGVQSGK